MTEEEQREWEEGFIQWEYEEYCKKTDKPLSMDEWLKSLPSPDKK
jgi:hypothetical protein